MGYKKNNFVADARSWRRDIGSVEYLHVVLIKIREHVAFITEYAQGSIVTHHYPLME